MPLASWSGHRTAKTLSGSAPIDEAVWAGGLHGQSPPLRVFLGGTKPDGTELFGGFLVGLQGFILVPEPSTMALGLLGAALLYRRRK